MKVLHVSTYDFGGAANSCIRLHLSLLENGVDSYVVHKKKKHQLVNSYLHSIPKFRIRLSSYLNKALRKIGIKINLNFSEEAIRKKIQQEKFPNLEFYSIPFSDYDITNSKYYKDADIIHLHWVSSYLDWPCFFRKNHKPLVMTLHDISPLSGGNHYDYYTYELDSNKIVRNVEFTTLQKEVFEKNLIIKSQLDYSHLSCLICPSEWIYRKASECFFLANTSKEVIPYGLDEEAFKCFNKIESRKFFNLPENSTLLLFIADSLENKRKGFFVLKEALSSIDNKSFFLVSIGDWDGENFSNHIHLGRINSESELSRIYSAVDLLILPSLEDNLPNVMLESLMCGNPVLSFPVGGSKDVIIHGFNGIILDSISVFSLVNGLLNFISGIYSFDSNEIRLNSISRFSKKIQFNKVINIYNRAFEKI